MRGFLDTLRRLKSGGRRDDVPDRPGALVFAAGIECSYPSVDGGRLQRDLLGGSGHYERWREDLDLVRALGLRHPRYGLPH